MNDAKTLPTSSVWRVALLTTICHCPFDTSLDKKIYFFTICCVNHISILFASAQTGKDKETEDAVETQLLRMISE